MVPMVKMKMMGRWFPKSLSSSRLSRASLVDGQSGPHACQWPPPRQYRRTENLTLSRLAFIRVPFFQEKLVFFLLQRTLFDANCSGAKPLSQKEIDALAPDPHARTNAINFLLAAVCGFFKCISKVFMLSTLL